MKINKDNLSSISSNSPAVSEEIAKSARNSAESATTKSSATSASTKLGVGSTPSSFVTEMAAKGGAVDPNTMVLHAMHESYLQSTKDLKSYADKVKHFNNTKKELREHLRENGDLRADVKDLIRQLKPENTNIMETLAAVLKESIQDNNESKKYYLNKLQDLNKIADSMQSQLEAIRNASKQLAKKERKKKDDDD